MSGASQRQDLNLSKDKNSNHEKSRAVRARQQVIGRELRRLYDSVVQEPVPDEFMELLRKMDTPDEGPSGKNSP